ncbi:MAG TPA: hypothetical protein VGK20_13715 [Candidatus Binatia bacterium]|jgi:hypothetical protein
MATKEFCRCLLDVSRGEIAGGRIFDGILSNEKPRSALRGIATLAFASVVAALASGCIIIPIAMIASATLKSDDDYVVSHYDVNKDKRLDAQEGSALVSDVHLFLDYCKQKNIDVRPGNLELRPEATAVQVEVFPVQDEPAGTHGDDAGHAANYSVAVLHKDDGTDVVYFDKTLDEFTKWLKDGSGSAVKR